MDRRAMYNTITATDGTLPPTFTAKILAVAVLLTEVQELPESKRLNAKELEQQLLSGLDQMTAGALAEAEIAEVMDTGL